MKRNKLMRVASSLTVLTLLTTSIISGTFAKYTTADDGSDTARVAKWGVVLQAEGNLFGKNYVAGATATTGNTKTADTTGITVESKQIADTNVVAPGTKNDGDGFAFSITGTPEVSTKLTATIKTQSIFLDAGSYGVMVKDTAVTASNWKTSTYYTESNGVYTLDTATAFNSNATYYVLTDAATVANKYYPVVYTLAGNTAVSGKTVTDDSLSAVAVAMATALNGGTAVSKSDATEDTDKNKAIDYYVVSGTEYAPNKNLAELKLDAAKLSWEWKYSDATDKNPVTDNDRADTILGNLMAVRVNASGSDNTYKDYTGVVVKKQTDGTYKAPTEYTDYCLDTMFSISVTATQID